jgi:hypothetical protein
MWQNFKSFLANDTVYLIGLIILVALASFFLGQASVESDQLEAGSAAAGVQVFTANPSPAPHSGASPAQPSAPEAETELVASKNGTRCHRLDCPGANQIKDSNKIYFSSVFAAEAAGYTPAANCDF